MARETAGPVFVPLNVILDNKTTPIWVNAAHIVHIRHRGMGAMVELTTQQALHVRELPEDIVHLASDAMEE